MENHQGIVFQLKNVWFGAGFLFERSETASCPVIKILTSQNCKLFQGNIATKEPNITTCCLFTSSFSGFFSFFPSFFAFGKDGFVSQEFLLSKMTCGWSKKLASSRVMSTSWGEVKFTIAGTILTTKAHKKRQIRFHFTQRKES